MMDPQEQIEELTTKQTNWLVGALAARMEQEGIITRTQWDRTIEYAKERA